MKSWYINDIKNVKVIEVYEINDNFEILYLKDGLKKSLSISHQCNFGRCLFELSGIALPMTNNWGKKTLTKRLVDIDMLLEIKLFVKPLENGTYQDLQITYKNKKGQTCNYLLNSAPDEEEVHRLDVYANRDSKLKKIEFDDSTFPKELYSTKIYKDTLAFALKAHKEQKTPEGLPYSFHIVSVANEIINSLSMHTISYDEANVAIACALLHDVNEDTDDEVSKNTIEFPSQNVDVVTSGVAALTKDETLPSKQKQMKDSLTRLKRMPNCVQMVKLADRITNLDPAPLFWNKAKRESYVKEAKMIHEALKDSNPYLAEKLQNKIDTYVTDYVLDLFGMRMDDRYVRFMAAEKQFILDKKHDKYLQTFKAVNRLNEYLLKTYDLELFRRWRNTDEFLLKRYNSRVGVDYIVEVLNKKDLLDLNKHTDDQIAKYMTTIYEGEEVIVLSAIR